MDEAVQPELPLPFPARADLPALPARMVNEYAYCPRLAYLEWVQGEWADSADTVEGRWAHRRADRASGTLPEPDAIGEEERIHARSVTLESERLGLVARVDLIEAEDGGLVPVDYKRGRRPHAQRAAYDPERVQIGVQVMLLRDAGYRADHGILYFVESRERVRVVFDEALERLTRSMIDGARLMAAGGRPPPPLEDSPKCPRCSLVGICLPDEVTFLRKPGAADGPEPRPLAVTRDEALPLYVQATRARIRKEGETLVVETEEGEPVKVRLIDVSQLVLFGAAAPTVPALHELMRRGVPVTWHSFGGWFIGHTAGTGHKNVELRTAQYRHSFDPAFCLDVARKLVHAKIRNARTLLRRNWPQGEAAAPRPEEAIALMRRDMASALRAKGLPELLGTEGLAANRYFGLFGGLLKGGEGDWPFAFALRNRRPPRDPVNALLSFAYAMLTRSFTVTLSAVGLDPYRGFYHQPRYGRPALSLDLMEPFRPLIADSSVLSAINNGELRPADFVLSGAGVALKPEGRKRFIAAFERRMGQEITHPVFGYRVSYRRLIEVQARLFGRFLLGEIPDYPQLTPR